jgi:hypothetical protein
MSVPLLALWCTFFPLYHCLLQENRKSVIELQTSVKQDDTTRTRTPKPGYLNLSKITAGDWFWLSLKTSIICQSGLGLPVRAVIISLRSHIYLETLKLPVPV